MSTRRFSSAERDYEQTGTAVDKTGHDSVFNDSPKALTTVLSAVEALCRYKLGLRTQTIL